MPETRAFLLLHFVSHLANDCSRFGIKSFESIVFVEVEIRFDAFVGFSEIPLHLNEQTRTPARKNEEQQQEETFGHDRAAE
jgi:hypothetical protein